MKSTQESEFSYFKQESKIPELRFAENSPGSLQLSLASIASKTLKQRQIFSFHAGSLRKTRHTCSLTFDPSSSAVSASLCLPSSYLHSCCCLTGALVLACSHTPPLTCLPRARTNPAVARYAQTYSKFLTSVLEKKGLNSQDIFHLFLFYY